MSALERLFRELESTRDPARARVLARELIGLAIDFDTLLLTAEELARAHPDVAFELLESIVARDPDVKVMSPLYAIDRMLRIDVVRAAPRIAIALLHRGSLPSLDEQLDSLRADPRFVHLFT